MDHRVFEIGLALSLMAGAAILAARLHFTNVPILILTGMAVGPHAPKVGLLDFRFIESAEIIAFMGRLGVLFLLFYLGLEFSVSRLIKSGRTILTGGSIYISINFLIGVAYPLLFGLPLKEVLIMAGITTITSTAIVAKVLVDLRRTANPETELILGMIMFDDVFLAIYLTLMSGIVLGGATTFGGTMLTMGFALAFILGMLGLGRLATPLLNRALRITSEETFLLVIFAGLFMVAGFGETLKVAEAIGALLFGMVLAETEHMGRIERLIIPFRNYFGALFFFSFGLTINPYALGGAVWMALGAVVLTILGNVTAGMLAGWRAGLSRRQSLTIGLTIVSRGELSIVVAKLAEAGNLLPILQPFAALYILIMAILGPLLTKESDRIASLGPKLFKRGVKAAEEAA